MTIRLSSFFLVQDRQLSKLDTIPVSIAVGNTMVHLVEMVRNLGYIMDKLLKNTSHINKTVSTNLLSN